MPLCLVQRGTEGEGITQKKVGCLARNYVLTSDTIACTPIGMLSPNYCLEIYLLRPLGVSCHLTSVSLASRQATKSLAAPRIKSILQPACASQA